MGIFDNDSVLFRNQKKQSSVVKTFGGVLRGSLLGLAALALAGCIELNRDGSIQLDGGAAERARDAEIEKSGLGGDILYVGANGGPNEFTSRSAAEAFVRQHKGKQASFRGNIMLVSGRGAIDVMHWSPYTRSRSCVPNHPVATCLRPKGGLPNTIVRCVGSNLSTLNRLTNGNIRRSTSYPWTRSGGWDTATITGRISRVTSGSTRIGSGVHISGAALADFGAIGPGSHSATFGFNVIELTGCRLAMFNGQAVTSK